MNVKQIEISHKDIFNFTSNGVVATDIDDRIVLFNQQAVNIIKNDEENECFELG